MEYLAIVTAGFEQIALSVVPCDSSQTPEPGSGLVHFVSSASVAELLAVRSLQRLFSAVHQTVISGLATAGPPGLILGDCSLGLADWLPV